MVPFPSSWNQVLHEKPDLVESTTSSQISHLGLHLVLKALMGFPFEPLASVSVRFVTLKTIFLTAITSARTVSELGSLSINLCVFQDDSVVLRLDPSFLPKINSLFHRTQELVLPTLCPNPNSPKEWAWHSLDVRRVLSFYIDHTREFRKSEVLFVLFGSPSGARKLQCLHFPNS